MNHVVDIIPEGMKTEEGRAEVEAAIEAKNEAIGQVFRALEALVVVTKWPAGRQRLAALMADFHDWEGEEGVQDADESFIQPALDAIDAYNEANEWFMEAVAGN